MNGDCTKCKGEGFLAKDIKETEDIRTAEIIKCPHCKNGKIEFVEVEVPEKCCGNCVHYNSSHVEADKCWNEKRTESAYTLGDDYCEHWQGKTKTAWVVKA